MSRANRRGLAAVLGALALGFFLAAPAAAQAQKRDILDEVRQRQEVEAQRLARQVDDAVNEAYRLARAGKLADALVLIKQVQTLVDGADIAKDRQEAMIRKLLAAGKQFEYEARQPVGPRPGDPVPKPLPPDRRYPDERRDQVGGARDVIQGRGGALRDAREIRELRAAGLIKVGNSIERSAIPESEDYVLPRDWAEKSRKRTEVRMTLRERMILKALAAPCSVEFKGEGFGPVIDYLQKKMDVPIILDPASLMEANVNPETTTVSVALNNVVTRSALKKILADVGLTYVIKDEAILVVTPERAKQMMTVRAYYVGDLVAATGVQYGPIYQMAQMNLLINNLLVLIQQTIEPNSWEYKGGPGSIVFDPVTMSFIVKQSAEMHFMLGLGLR
jgi:hypothetical protein